tara:strand:- start:453 stop:782 length:330 start_codon:yes stop_codon:yes gene_type:complete
MNPLISDTETRTESIRSAGDSIAAVIESCGYKDKLNQAKIMGVWPAAVKERLGPEALESCKSAKIREDQLILEVSSSAWRHRLAFEVNLLVEAINKSLGSEVLSSIRLV